MGLRTLAGAGAFFALGLAGGLHCAGMCGPLSCVLGQTERQGAWPLGLYHGARLASYALLGIVASRIGAPLRPLLNWPLIALLAGLPLLVYGLFGLDGVPRFLGPWHAVAVRRLVSWPLPLRSFVLGLLTPALPCGLLYAAVLGAAGAQNWKVGAEWMLSFGAGTLPLLAAGQVGFSVALRRVSPAAVKGLRRAAALLTAGSIFFLALPR